VLFLLKRGDILYDLADIKPKGFKRTRRVNGEKVIEFTAIPFEENENTFDLIVEESSVNALDDKYIIKKLTEQSRGKKYIKQVTAIHKFYVDLINKQQPKIHNGSITFNNYMNLVFEDTGYTFVAIDQFNARSFENLGNENRLALLQKGLERFQAEFELVGNQVRFRHQIGNDTDFQFRFGHNIKAIKRDIDTTNLATVISGTGDPELGIEAYYRSDNADIFGELDAPPVNDERFKSEPALLEEMISRLQDEPLVTLTIDFVDLRAAGYPYTVPNEGDRVWVIYEPMDDLLIETRIMEIVEYFDVNLNVIKTEVTLSNHKKSFAGTMFDNVRKQLAEIVDEDGIVRTSVLDEAVRVATESIHNARTELQFPESGGIVAVDKTDPNKLVVYNSAGLGISSDGGNTFETAITGDGIVAETIMSGSFGGNTFTGGIFTGSVFEQIGTDGTMRVDDDGLKIFNTDGDLRAAILLGGTQGIDNALGLTLIDDGESVFEINQDGEKASVYSKIDLEFQSENDIAIVKGNTEALRIIDDGQIYIPTKAVSRGINIGGHVITRHNTDDSLTIYPERRIISNDPMFRIRSHRSNGNYVENLRITNDGRIQVGHGISLGANASSTDRKFDIFYNSFYEWVQFIASDDHPMSFRLNNERIHILWDIYYNGVPLSTSRESEKLLMQDISVNPYKLLEMNVFDYYDKRSVEEYADILNKGFDVKEEDLPLIRRIPGLSANQAHELGLNRFVHYKNNEVDGLMYDRLWTLLIPITKDHEDRLNEYDNRFGTIENRIDKLEQEIEKLKGAV